MDAPFVRLWRGFLTGRVMVALALLVLQGAGQAINQTTEPAVLAVCVAYLVAAVMLRVLGRHSPPSPKTGPNGSPPLVLTLLRLLPCNCSTQAP